jgi:hypothetical protein
MGIEDTCSSMVRSYLACKWSDVKALEGAFSDLDNDNSGALDANEFQDLMFALGVEMSDEEAQKEVATIDLVPKNKTHFFLFLFLSLIFSFPFLNHILLCYPVCSCVYVYAYMCLYVKN